MHFKLMKKTQQFFFIKKISPAEKFLNLSVLLVNPVTYSLLFLKIKDLTVARFKHNLQQK